jgi:hypothetical protein
MGGLAASLEEADGEGDQLEPTLMLNHTFSIPSLLKG